MRRQMEMEERWMVAAEAREAERRAREEEWRAAIVALGEERLALVCRWREREERMGIFSLQASGAEASWGVGWMGTDSHLCDDPDRILRRSRPPRHPLPRQQGSGRRRLRGGGGGLRRLRHLPRQDRPPGHGPRQGMRPRLLFLLHMVATPSTWGCDTEDVDTRLRQ